MEFGPSSEQRSLAEVVRAVCARHSTMTHARRDAMGGTADLELWKVLATDVGLQAILVPEQSGGLGGSLLDVVAAYEELGGALAAGPYVASAVMATLLLRECAEAATASSVLNALADGTGIATTSLDPEASTLHLDPSGPPAATGSVRWVSFAELARFLVVLSDLGDLLLIELSGPGIAIQARASVDATQSFSTIHLDQAPAHVLASGTAAADAHRRATVAAQLALNAERVGAAARGCDMAVSYAKERFQFGRAIGSFQSVKHQLADVFIAIEYARSANWLAAWTFTQGDNAAAITAAASAQAAEALELAATVNVQVHGAIATTWEHDAHLYLKRSVATKALLGAPQQHYESLARHYLGGAPI